MFSKKLLLASSLACLSVPTMAQPPETLAALIQQTWAQNPSLEAAKTAVAAARVRAEGANRPFYNPSLELDAERAANSTALSVGMTQAFDWANKQGSQADIARLQINFTKAEQQALRRQIAIETSMALVRYQNTRIMLNLAKKRSDLMQQFADTVQKRYQAGDMRALDAALATLAHSEALMQQAAIRGDLADNAASLQAVTGLTLETWPSLPNALPSLNQHDKPRLLRALPSLQVLQAQMETATARIQLARRERKADPIFGIRAGRAGSDNMLGLSLELPLFVRNNFASAVKAAALDVDQHKQLYQATYRRAAAQFDGATQRFQQIQQAWQTWQSIGQQAQQEQARLLTQLWQAGELTASDYLIQAKQNVDTETAAMDLKGTLWQAAIAWLAASGQVENWLALDKTTGSSK